jgi:flagellar capping protein FliD
MSVMTLHDLLLMMCYGSGIKDMTSALQCDKQIRDAQSDSINKQISSAAEQHRTVQPSIESKM